MTVISLYLTCKAKKIDTNRILLFCVLTLSMIWFVYYNWVIVAVGFMTAAIYFWLRKRAKLSSVFLGLGAAAKLIPLVLLPVFMQQGRGGARRFQIAGITLGVFWPSISHSWSAISTAGCGAIPIPP
ncbi:MAG: glycosyltransferase 87 family protein [Candidatus Hadarchaeum sp.]|uniref:glycosyltransferase 87 family protein n=1 Tax=Candidatus Hadarchaeum sp. TaxID=2883567 RepID=UPI003D109570